MRRITNALTWVMFACMSLAGLSNAGCRLGDGPTAGEAVDGPPVLTPRSDLIAVGATAPGFSAADQDGGHVRLSELLKTRPVVLIFYPADFTPGCTRQLCAVRDDWSEFQKRGAVVLGVNPADSARHARFATENHLPFPLIVDEGSRIAAAYGAQGTDHTRRTVYVIRRDGTVALAERGMVTHERIFAALK